jgi:integrase/recombinase XerD
MLTIYRRHRKPRKNGKGGCGHRNEGRGYRGCKCPIWVDGFLSGAEFRQSLNTCDWQKAQDIVRKWEAEGQITVKQEPQGLAGAWDSFISDAKARGLREPTIRKYTYFRKQMEAFARDRGLRFVNEFDVDTCGKLRESWHSQNLSALKKLELLRSFLRFCQDRGWIADNPARKVRNPKIAERQTLPFSQEEVIRALAACDEIERSTLAKSRFRALVLLLRFGGLRIGDAVTLSRSRIVDGKLFLYTSKAGTPVYCPLPTVALGALDALPVAGEHYFWTGHSKPKTAISHYQCGLSKLFETAKVNDGHAHRLRDTFAVGLLLEGVPMERVSVLLGHRSIRVTEKHYAPWVRARQEQLEADVKRTWASDPAAHEGTPQVHGKSARIN